MTFTFCILQALALVPQAEPPGGSVDLHRPLFADLYGDIPVELGGRKAPAPDEMRPDPQDTRPGGVGQQAELARRGSLFIDLDRLEVEPRLSLVLYGGDAEADPEAGIGVLARAPMPWLSPRHNARGDYWALFVEFTVTQMDRDLDPPAQDTSGTVVFFGFGVDYTIVRSKRFLLLAQGGFEYGNFGGIEETDDGVALLLGGLAGYRLSNRIWVSYNPQMHLGFSGDWAFLNQLGITITF
jgi:hypothetical protein